MGINRSRAATLVGLGAAVGAFGAAAMMSAAAAPPARADDLTDIINAVNGDFTVGQSDFTAAFTDFSSNMVPAGLTNFFDGVDEDFWAAPSNVEIGTIEALTGESILGSLVTGIPTPSDFADAETLAATEFNGSLSVFADAETLLAAGQYGLAAFDESVGFLSAFYIPAEILFIGGVEALGL